MKHVVFDCDGVLVDTEGYQWQAWNEALKPYGINISKKEYFDYAGKSGDIIEKEIVKKYSLKIEAGRLLEKKEKTVVKYFKEKPLKTLPFAEEALQTLQEKNIIIAVASSSPKEELLLKLEKNNLRKYFQIIVSKENVSRGKPFPDIYLKTAELLKTNPKNIIVIEDTQYGVESAKAAGTICYAIPNEYSEKQDFSKADKKFKNLKEATNTILKA